MFFARATAVGNLPANQALADPDLYLVEWYFRFASGGAFSTMGPIRGVPDGSNDKASLAVEPLHREKP